MTYEELKKAYEEMSEKCSELEKKIENKNLEIEKNRIEIENNKLEIEKKRIEIENKNLEIENLTEQLLKRNRMLFGKKSERSKYLNVDGQLAFDESFLVNEAEEQSDENADEPDAEAFFHLHTFPHEAMRFSLFFIPPPCSCTEQIQI